MGRHEPQKDLFSYHIDLDKRVRPENPLRRVAEKIDFTFVRDEVAKCYGRKGNESVDPVIILKMMFLLFYDDVASERELMKIIAERLDYLWFLGYSLDEDIPNHSVLSKARTRWGKEVFEGFFVRIVMQCVQAGLVGGKKIHVDSSLIDANASKDSVVKGCPELIAAVKQAYQAQESKLEDTSTPEDYQAINDRMVSATDPDAALTRKGADSARPRYHHHRVVVDAQGVITAVETTPGSIAENKKLMAVMQQHQQNTQKPVSTVVADHKYGTAENYVAGQKAGWTTHMGDVLGKQDHSQKRQGIFPDSAFVYHPEADTYTCPAGQTLKPRRVHPFKRTWEYVLSKKICAACSLREQCTRATATGRTIRRHEHQELLDTARQQAHSPEARRDRKRRQIVMEQSFADAANNHGFKRSRWRRLWRQQIQDYLIAAIQNIRILLSRGGANAAAGVAALKIIPFEALSMVFLILETLQPAVHRPSRSTLSLRT
ncbi:MAG TPA: IS1182 family transposase [Blastocatellia bacterium]|nr:IS1182 family transposase [Blastocatellia bacterium]